MHWANILDTVMIISAFTPPVNPCSLSQTRKLRTRAMKKLLEILQLVLR